MTYLFQSLCVSCKASGLSFMKKFIFLFLLPIFTGVGWLLPGCSSKKTGEVIVEELSAEDVRFNAFKEALILKFWKMHPEWASSQGYHRYDHVLVIQTNEWRQGVVKTYANSLKELEAFGLHKLSDPNKIDYYMLLNFLKAGIWNINEFKEYQWNPAQYNLGSGVAEIINGRYANLEARLMSISEKIAPSVTYYETAINNIEKPTREHTLLAISQNQGALDVFGPALLDSVQKSNLAPHQKDQLGQRIQTTRIAIENYIHHLQQTVLPQLRNGRARSFRIGKDQYDQKFRFEIESGYTAKEVYQKAMLRKRELHENMLGLTKKLWPKYFPDTPLPEGLSAVKQMIQKLSEKHVPRDSFLVAIRRQIPELVAFVNQKNLLTQDPGKPLQVRPTPRYMRGVAGASISAPGPYDKEATTYYNVTPLDQYTPAQAESYLREYNQYMLQILNIHEAIPGHYTQLVYSNRSPSIVKAVLGNGAMVEGWAVYAEHMMLEQGYGQNSPEMWLMWYKWNLRVTLNTVLDYSVHVGNMAEQEAVRLLTQEGFQEEAEAREKWKRVTLSQVQLTSYFTGYTEIYDLREKYKKDMGNKFDLKTFHEQFLSYGSAPVRHIRRLMLNE
jgi:hypothetical protein